MNIGARGSRWRLRYAIAALAGGAALVMMPTSASAAEIAYGSFQYNLNTGTQFQTANFAFNGGTLAVDSDNTDCHGSGYTYYYQIKLNISGGPDTLIATSPTLSECSGAAHYLYSGLASHGNYYLRFHTNDAYSHGCYVVRYPDQVTTHCT